MSDDTQDRMRRPPLREAVCEIDRDLLKLLLRRHNLVARMSAPKGRLAPQEERFLREAWESQASKISRDPKLVHLFTLLQGLEFLPKPSEDAPQRRPGFNLAPARAPVKVRLEAPCDQTQTRLWAYLAAASGRPVRLDRSLMNDAVVDCVRMLNQFGASLYREGDAILSGGGQPAEAPDKIVHAGDSSLNFYLCVAHYLGRPSHAKITGGPALKLADFSFLRRFLPSLGARLISLVPKSDGLPVRLESAAVLPDTLRLPADIPPEFALCLMAAAPFFSSPVAFDLSDLPDGAAASLLARALPLLEQAGAAAARDGAKVSVPLFKGPLPAEPRIAADLSVSMVLLCLAAFGGGGVRLAGDWPDTPEARAAEALLSGAGLSLVRGDGAFSLEVPADYAIPEGAARAPEGLPGELAPLRAALACAAALRSGRADAPEGPWSEEDLAGFAGACGLELAEDGLRPMESRPKDPIPWTAPTPMWACALALAACARTQDRGYVLNNPGILTELHPAFWTVYNALPEPVVRRAEAPAPAQQRERRRIRTSQPARLTPRPEEDL